MSGVLVDSTVILDIFLDDPQWADWSESRLLGFDGTHPLYINPIIYTEVSVGFERIEERIQIIISATSLVVAVGFQDVGPQSKCIGTEIHQKDTAAQAI